MIYSEGISVASLIEYFDNFVKKLSIKRRLERILQFEIKTLKPEKLGM